MPQVKTYNGPQVREAAPGNIGYSARATPQQMGAGVGAALGQVGQLMQQNALQMKAKDDEAKIKTAVNDFRKYLNERQYLDDDAYFNRKGLDAYETFQSSLDEYTKYQKEMAKTLSPGRQQEAFNAAVDQYLTNEHGQMSRFAAAERTNWLNQSDTSGIEQAQQDGSLRFIDNAKYTAQIDKYIVSLADRNGWPEDKIAMERQKYVSGMHTAALDVIFQKAPGVAQDYFDAHKDDISPVLHDEIQKQIKSYDDSVWVQESAEKVRFSGGSRAERLKMADDLTDDPDRRSSLKAQIEHDLTQEKLAEQEAQSQAYDIAFDAIVDPTGSGMSYVEFERQNPELWDSLSPAQKRTIISDASDPTASRETNLGAYNSIRGMLADGKRGEAREYLLENTDQFSKTDWKSLLNETYKKDGATDNASLLTAEARRQFDDWIETTLGKEPTKDKARREWNQKRNFALGMYEGGLTENSDFDSRRKALDSMTQKVYGGEKFWSFIPGVADYKEVDLFDLSSDSIEAVTNDFDRLGIPMTQDNVTLYINEKVDMSDPLYSEAARALKLAGVPISVHNLRNVVSNYYQLPVE